MIFLLVQIHYATLKVCSSKLLHQQLKNSIRPATRMNTPSKKLPEELFSVSVRSRYTVKVISSGVAR